MCGALGNSKLKMDVAFFFALGKTEKDLVQLLPGTFLADPQTVVFWRRVRK